jgi:hypothetical protein
MGRPARIMNSRILPLLLLLLALLPARLAALSPVDEADMVRGMAYLRIRHNDPEGLPIVYAVMSRLNYTADDRSTVCSPREAIADQYSR